MKTKTLIILLVFFAAMICILIGCNNVPCPVSEQQYMGPLFFAVGANGYNYYFENETDGWQRWPVYSAQSHYGVTSFNMGTFDRVMIVGVDGWYYDDKIVENEPGASWHSVSLGGGDFFDVTYGNGVLVAVGYDNSTAQRGRIIYSDDWGNSWFEAYQVDSGFNTTFWGVAHGNGIFIAVGKNVMYSIDGINWTESSYVPKEYFRGIAFGNGHFVAIGNVHTPLTGGSPYTVIATTTDGISWSDGNSGTDKTLNDIAYDPDYASGRFVAVGWNGTIIYSDDLGATWASATSGSSSHLNAIAYGNGMLMAGGGNSAVDGTIDTCYSTDHGLTWTVLSNQTVRINGICWKP